MPIIYSHTRSHEPENQAKRYWDEESTPIYPFGYGLGYGRVSYCDLSLSQATIAPEDTLTVSVRVENVGDHDTDEVVQVYVHQRHGRASRPVRELKGFRRVALPAGHGETVTFSLGPDERRYWNAALRDWVLDESVFDVFVGGDCTAEASASFAVAEDRA